MPTLRLATAADALPLAALAERTFRATFEAMNTPEDMALHCASHYSEAIQTAELVDPAVTTLVSEQDGQLIGYAQLRWGPAPPCVVASRPAEVQRLYVDAAWHGQGVARDLLNHALHQAAEAGADHIWLGVWEHNPRAIAFYRKFGFEEVGAHVFPLGTDPQRDIIMVRPASLA